MTQLRALILALAAASTGCSRVVGDLALDGKQCPCVEGWFCDPASNLCRPTAQAGSGAVRVSNLRALWATPNQIRWGWDVKGAASDLREYQLVVGRSPEEVTSAAPGTVVFRATRSCPPSGACRKQVINPELGYYVLPRTGAGDVVTATTSDELSPATDYYAQLSAVDTSGGLTQSNVAGQRTAVPASAAIEIFRDSLPPGATLSIDSTGCTTFTVSSDRPYRGSADLEFTQSCPQSRWDNLHLLSLQIDTSAISAGSFLATAYLELAVASNARVTSYYSDVYFGFGSGGDPTKVFARYSGWTMRSDDQYRIIQVPLRVMMVAEGSPVQYSDVERGVGSFALGGDWDSPTTVRIDEVQIFY